MGKINLCLLIFVCFLLIGSVSAMEVDNVKNYDLNTKTITVKNAFGLGDDIAKVKLNTPLYYEVSEGYGKVAEFEVTNFKDYDNAFKELELFNKNKKDLKFTRDFNYKVRSYKNIEVDDYENVIAGTNKNGSAYYENQKVGSHIEQREVWTNLLTSDFKKNDVLTIGIFTEVEKGDYVEWIPNMFGVRIDEWATWVASLNNGLLAYYDFSESSGDLINLVDGEWNGTIQNMTSREVAIQGSPDSIGWGYNFVHANNDYINISRNSTGNTPLFSTPKQTISIWFNSTFASNDTSANRYAFVGSENTGYAQPSYIIKESGGGMDLAIGGTSLFNNYNISGWWNLGNYNLMVLTYDETLNNLTIYVNNVLKYSNQTTAFTHYIPFVSTIGEQYNTGSPLARTWDGGISEVGIWNRVLTNNEISDLYSSGEGMTYLVSSAIKTSLISPADSLETVLSTLQFQGSSVISNGNLTNATLTIWDASDTVFATNFTTLTGTSNTSKLNISALTVGDYKWNYEFCGINASGGLCDIANNNRTFSVETFEENSITFNNNTNEGVSEEFILNITPFPGNSLSSANLVYNNTNYVSSISFSGGEYSISSIITIPLVTADTNKTFRFELTMGGMEYNSTSNIQYISNLNFSSCGVLSSDVLLNASLISERARIPIFGDIQIGADIISKTSGDIVASISDGFINVSSASICFSPVSSYNLYYLDTEIRYTSTEYVSEFYNIQKADLGDYPKNISLFDLNSNYSTEFLIKYQDNNLIAVEGAIVQLLRKYIENNTFEVVEAPLTSNIGTTIVHIDLDTNKYSAVVVKDGVILDTFNNIVFDCESELSGLCTQNLFGSINPQNSISVENLNDFSYEITTVNQTITTTFSIPSGTPQTVNINLEQLDMFGNSTLCNQTIYSSAGSIDCTYNDTIGDSMVYLTISKNGVIQAQKSYFIKESGGIDFLNNNFFIVLIFLLSLVGMGISSPEWMIINGVLVLVISGGLWLINGLNFVVGLGGIIWLLVASGILIFKLTKQEDK